MANSIARHLRANSTEAERRLWRLLKDFKHRGFHVRRQVAVGRYIADFLTFGPRLVVELDGSQHGEADAMRQDQDRTAFLEAQGFTVLRFWNYEVFSDVEAVARAIEAKLKELAPYRHAIGEKRDAVIAPLGPKPPRSRATRRLPPRRSTPTPDPSPQGGGEIDGRSDK